MPSLTPMLPEYQPAPEPTLRVVVVPPPLARTCPVCHGGGVVYVRDCERHNFPHPLCTACRGAGFVLAEVE